MDTTGLASLASTLQEIENDEKSVLRFAPEVLESDMQNSRNMVRMVFQRLRGGARSGSRRKGFALLLAVHDVVLETYQGGDAFASSAALVQVGDAMDTGGSDSDADEDGDGMMVGNGGGDRDGGADAMDESGPRQSFGKGWEQFKFPPITAYFSVMLSLLVSSSHTMTDADKAGAMVLMRELVRHVPTKVIQRRFPAAATCLLLIASQCRDADTSHVVCAIVIVAALLFKGQGLELGRVDWAAVPQLIPLFQLLFSLAIDDRVDVRRCAHEAVYDVVSSSRGVAKKAGDIIRVFSMEVFAHSEVNEKRTIYLMELYQSDLLSHLPADTVSGLYASFGNMMSCQNRAIATSALIALRLLFMNSLSSVTVQMGEQMLQAALDLDTRAMPSTTVTAYCLLLCAIVVRLKSMFAESLYSWLPVVARRVMQCFTSSTPEAYGHLVSGMQCLLRGCVDRNMAVQHAESVSAVLKAVKEGLGYQYQQAWPHVLEVMGIAFRACCYRDLPLLDGVEASVEAVSWVLLLVRTDERFTRDLYAAAEQALGAAIKALGCRTICSILPLNLELAPTDENRREWLLPILAAHLHKPSLEVFALDFLPVIDDALQANDAALGENTRLLPLIRKLWNLFPSFCRGAVDVPTAFTAEFAKRMAMTVEGNVSARPVVAAGLVELIRSFHPLPDQDRPAHITNAIASESLKAISRFAPQYLPILFNVYMETSSSGDDVSRNFGDLRAHGGPVLAAVRAFLDISNPADVHKHYTTLMKKLLEAQNNEDDDKVVSLTGLVRAFIPSISVEQKQFAMDAISPQLRSEDARIQKRSYAVFAEFCEAASAEYVRERLSHFCDILETNRESCKSQAKRFRYRCLSALVESLSSKQLERFVRNNLPEVISGCKELNARAKSEAITLLLSLGRRIAVDEYLSKVGRSNDGEESDSDFEVEDEDLSMDTFAIMCSAGLAGQSHTTVSATVRALAALLHHFHTNLSNKTQHQMVQTIVVLLASPVNQVAQSAVEFVRVASGVCPVAVLRHHLKSIVESAVALAQSSRSKYGNDAKIVIERMFRKFSFEELQPFVSGPYVRVLSNIRKKSRRREALRNTDKWKSRMPRKDEDEFSDDDDDELEALKDEDAMYGRVDREIAAKDRRKSKKKKKGRDGTIVLEGESSYDMLDVNSVKNLLSADRQKGKMHDDDKHFPQDVRGRFVIEDEETVAKRKKAAAMELEEPLYTYEELMETKSLTDKTAKRTFRMLARHGDDYEHFADEEEIAAAERDGDEDEPASSSSGPDRKRRKVQTKKGGVGVHTGIEYRAKKAKGDIRKKGKVDPYAYIALNPKQLNKRHRSQAKKQFAELVQKKKNKRNKR